MGRPKKLIDVKEAERLAGLGLNVNEMAACLGISADTFYERQKKYSEFSEAICRGRAMRVAAMAEVIVSIAQDKNEESGVRLRAAEMYLKRHGQGWRESGLPDTGPVGESTKTVFTEEQMLRAAKAYIQLRG